MSGIWFPGLMCCGSAIQSAQVESARSGSSARRASSRLPRCVRSGPTSPSRRGAADRVAARQQPRRKTCAPAAARSPRGAGRPPRSRASAGTAPAARRRRRGPCARAAARRTRRTGRGSGRPRRRRARSRSSGPGSCRSSGSARGTQKLWITSAVRTSTRTGVRDRDVDLVRGDGARARVADLPPPLVADHARRSAGWPAPPAPASCG